MKKNLFYKFVTVFGFFTFLVLLGIFIYLKYQNIKNEPIISEETEMEEPQIKENYVFLHAEKDEKTNKITLYMEPTQTNGNVIKLSAFELNIKIFADDFEVIEAKKDNLLIDSNMVDAGWKFPILQSLSLETGEVALKVAGYFTNEDGFELLEKTPIASMDLTKIPKNEIFVSEFIKENTHFYSKNAMDPVPFIIK